MKKLYTLVMLCLFCITVQAQEKKEVIKLSEPIQVTDKFEVYGAKPGDVNKTESLSNALKQNTSKEEQVVIKTKIARVCEKKGCFFIAQDGDASARITFKDYGFFIPTDSQGKVVTIVGALSKKEISEEQAKHYAKDAGEDESLIKGPQVEYSIVATSIIIEKNSGK